MTHYVLLVALLLGSLAAPLGANGARDGARHHTPAAAPTSGPISPQTSRPVEHATASTPTAVMRAARDALAETVSISYRVRSAEDPAGLPTTVTVATSPFRYRAEQRAQDGTLVSLAVSDGETTLAREGGNPEIMEAPTFTRDRLFMPIVNEATRHVAATVRVLTEPRFWTDALDSDALADAGTDDIEGDLCDVVLYSRNVFRYEWYHLASYLWISRETGLPRAIQTLRRVRGQNRLAPKYILSEIRLNPSLEATSFALDTPTSARQAPISPRPGETADNEAEVASATRSTTIDGLSEVARSLVGRPLPTLDVRDLRFQPLDLEAFRGRPMLLNLWATWCAPCEAEMPVLGQLQQRYGGELQIVAVAAQDSRVNVAAWIEQRGEYPFVFATDPDMQSGSSRLESTLGFVGLPTSFFVDASGRVVDVWFGFTDEARLIERVERLMESASR